MYCRFCFVGKFGVFGGWDFGLFGRLDDGNWGFEFEGMRVFVGFGDGWGIGGFRGYRGQQRAGRVLSIFVGRRRALSRGWFRKFEFIFECFREISHSHMRFLDFPIYR